MGEDGASVWAWVAAGGVVLLFAGAVWLGLRQRRSLHVWLDGLQRAGWVEADEPLESRWLALIGERGFGLAGGAAPVKVERPLVNPGPGPLRAAFLLSRAGGPVGCGVVARLPRPVAPALMLIPQPAVGPRVWETVVDLDLPSAPTGDSRFDERWTAYGDDPRAASAALEREPALRDALVAVLEDALGLRGGSPKISFPVIELDGDRALLFAGPKAVNQRPFEALQEAAQKLAAAVGG